MPFDKYPGGSRNVAVIGAGISGLGAAYALSFDAKVTVFEAAGRLGGHARTVEVDGPSPIAVDTGFIVFNRRNYPLLTGLFDTLDVPVKRSNMSFGASFAEDDVEYALRDLDALFAQRRNIARPRFLAMIRDILRFNKRADEALAAPEMTLGEFLDGLQVSEAFRRWYILPFSGAIWSASAEDMLRFPARSFVQFFKNHGLLSSKGQPVWETVDGGSREYVMRIEHAIRANGGEFRLSTPVHSVEQDWHGGGPVVSSAAGAAEQFDAVIMACHSDQALTMLANPDREQQATLGALRYSENRAFLHTDAGQMPRRKRCWSSWNAIQGGGEAGRPAVTYWMNRLQSIPEETPLFVTLNPTTEIPEEAILDETTFAHPMFDLAALRAQEALPSIQGRRGVWFAGAYARYGFHEDGLMSGLAAAKALGADAAWAEAA